MPSRTPCGEGRACVFCGATLVRRARESRKKWLARRACNVTCARRGAARAGLNNRRFPPDREDWWRPLTDAPDPFAGYAAAFRSTQERILK